MNNTATTNQYKSGSNSNWKLPNIAIMVAGFVIFPPVGFAVLAWLVFGKNVDIANKISNKFNGMSTGRKCCKSSKKRHYGNTGNMAFDSYKADSIAKLEEEMQRRKVQLKEEEVQFSEFVTNLQQAKDQAEFNQFMKAQESAENAVKSNEEVKQD
ncbi:MAG: DUF2852 domain-containing protein [Rhizobiales bacterium]|nr:DUF2852 domain-containing protein [Hyphomicrobiales bacterium]